MNFLKFSILILLFFGSSGEINSQWIERRNGLPSNWGSQFGAIDAVDSNNAVVVLENPHTYGSFIYKTSNGGLDWYKISDSNFANYFGDISIVASNNIWVSSISNLKQIFRTSDGGFSWIKQYEQYDSTGNSWLEYIEMFDLNNGVAVGSAFGNIPAPVLKTTNGGLTWQSVNNNYLLGFRTNAFWASIDFIDMNTGFYARKFQSVHKTTDGGETWNEVLSSSFSNVLKFYDNSYGINTIGSLFQITTNGGNYWQLINSDIDNARDIEFLPGDPSKIWVVDSEFYFSNDSGRTWTSLSLGSDLDGMDIEFVDEKHGWLLTGNTV